MPTHSAEQWSTATNTAAWPSPVIVEVRSVPHIVSTVSGMIVPSWLRGPRGAPFREGASRPCSRVSRSTRRLEVRTPPWRSLAQTLRWPSPWNGLAASTARIASSRSASGIGPTGPGRRGAALQPLALQLLAAAGPGRQGDLPGRQEGVTPPAERGRGHAQRARDRLQVLAPQQPQHRRGLALPRHPSAPPGADLARARRLCRHRPPFLRRSSAYRVSRPSVGRGTDAFEWVELPNTLGMAL